MTITALRNRSPEEVHDCVSRFHSVYGDAWDRWLAVATKDRPVEVGRVLRCWQATRPHRMRRCRAEAQHPPPFIEDLVEEAAPALRRLRRFDLATDTIVPRDAAALADLWNVFERLPVEVAASCVGITKAVLLLSDGRIGPALDSHVRKNAGVAAPKTSSAWVETLRCVGEDVAGFEARWGVSFRDAAPAECRHLGLGRLYDMVFA